MVVCNFQTLFLSGCMDIGSMEDSTTNTPNTVVDPSSGNLIKEPAENPLLFFIYCDWIMLYVRIIF